MEEDSDSTSSRDHSLLCGFSGRKKSTTKESQPRKSFFNSFRKSPQKQPQEDSSRDTDGKEPSAKEESSRALGSGLSTNTVSQRRAVFENLSRDQSSKPSLEQPSAKTGKR